MLLLATSTSAYSAFAGPGVSSDTRIHAFVTSRVDYCNTLLAGAPKVTTDKLQRVLNAAARLFLYRYPQVRPGPVAAAAHRAALARHTWQSLIQARSHHVRLIGCLHDRAPQYLTDVYRSPIWHYGSTFQPGRTASPSQHVRPPGFCRRWPDGLELFPG